MGVAPGLHVTADVDGMAGGPGLAVEIGDLRALYCLVHVAGRVEIGQAWNAGAGVCCVGSEGFEQILHGKFAFAEDDEVCASLEIFKSVGTGFRTADDGLPAGLAGYLEDLDDVAACHEIGIDADHGWCLCPEMLKERLSI